MTRMNDPGRDGKILVALTLAGSQFARRGHRGLVYNRLDRKGFFARASPCGRCRRGPHIGEYGRKTNPVSRWLPFADQVRKGAPGPPFVGQWPSLLVVVLQDLVAGLRDLGPVLLEAGQDGEITLVDDRTAELLHIARAGLLLGVRAAPLLGERCGREGGRQQGESDEKLTHCIPSF